MNLSPTNNKVCEESLEVLSVIEVGSEQCYETDFEDTEEGEEGNKNVVREQEESYNYITDACASIQENVSLAFPELDPYFNMSKSNNDSHSNDKERVQQLTRAYQEMIKIFSKEQAEFEILEDLDTDQDQERLTLEEVECDEKVSDLQNYLRNIKSQIQKTEIEIESLNPTITHNQEDLEINDPQKEQEEDEIRNLKLLIKEEECLKSSIQPFVGFQEMKEALSTRIDELIKNNKKGHIRTHKLNEYLQQVDLHKDEFFESEKFSQIEIDKIDKKKEVLGKQNVEAFDKWKELSEVQVKIGEELYFLEQKMSDFRKENRSLQKQSKGQSTHIEAKISEQLNIQGSLQKKYVGLVEKFKGELDDGLVVDVGDFLKNKENSGTSVVEMTAGSFKLKDFKMQIDQNRMEIKQLEVQAEELSKALLDQSEKQESLFLGSLTQSRKNLVDLIENGGDSPLTHIDFSKFQNSGGERKSIR